MKKVLAIGTVSIAAIALLAAFAGRLRSEHGDPKQAYKGISAHVNAILDEIKATDAQREKVNAIKDKLWQDGQGLKNAHQELHKDLMAQWQQPTVDAAKAHALVDQRIDQFRAFAHEVVDSGIELHDLLTPEQRAKVKDEMRRHHEERGHPHDE